MEQYEKHVVEFSQIKQYNFPNSYEPFILEINKDNVKFEFLIRLKGNSEKAIIFGSGAYDATSNLNPPIFQRHKWIKHFEENLIFYNDPTLYLGKINMGWGFGFKDRHYLEEIAELLKIILEMSGIKSEKTLFYGSSAGGFMSLMLGGIVKNSKVLVNNPQTIIWNYYDRHVNAMFDCTQPNLSREEILQKYRERLNILEFYKSIKYVPEITYLQNISSKRDITHHLNPFILGLEEILDEYIDNSIEIQLYSNSEQGHSPLGLQDSLNWLTIKASTL